MIVDEADKDIAMAKDPFLEAGIDIPEELPYQPTPIIKRKMSIKPISGIPIRLRSDSHWNLIRKNDSGRKIPLHKSLTSSLTSNLKIDKNDIPNSAPIKSSTENGEFLFPAPSNQNIISPNSTKDVNIGRKMPLHQSQTDIDSERNGDSDRGFITTLALISEKSENPVKIGTLGAIEVPLGSTNEGFSDSDQ